MYLHTTYMSASMHFSMCVISLHCWYIGESLGSYPENIIDWLHPVFSVVVVCSECGVPITKRSYSFYKQSLYDGDQFVIMAVITKNNAANTRIHLYRQPATETWRWITAQLGTGKPQLIGVHYGINTLQCNTMVSYRLKKAAPKPPLFSRPCGQLVGLTPIFGSWFGLAALDSLSSFLWSSRYSFLSPRGYPLVTKVFPLVTKDQGSTPPFTLFWSEVWRTYGERTYGPDAHTYCLFYSIRWLCDGDFQNPLFHWCLRKNMRNNACCRSTERWSPH